MLLTVPKHKHRARHFRLPVHTNGLPFQRPTLIGKPLKLADCLLLASLCNRSKGYPKKHVTTPCSSTSSALARPAYVGRAESHAFHALGGQNPQNIFIIWFHPFELVQEIVIQEFRMLLAANGLLHPGSYHKTTCNTGATFKDFPHSQTNPPKKTYDS